VLVPPVDVQRRRVGKVLAAVLAGVFDAVGEEVSVEALPVLQRLPAEAAQEGARVRVRPDVLLQVRFDLEGLSAYLADVSLQRDVRVLLVHPHLVLVHGRLGGRAVVAKLALVRLLASVQPHVQLQSQCTRQPLCAYGACVLE